MSDRAAALLLRLVALVVPRAQRGEWLEEWRGELEALRRYRAEAPRPDGMPTPMGFAAGAIPHALWTRTEGWTMDSVMQDLRFAGRVLRRSPGFTLVAALTLALGIGANASIFSLINGLMFRVPAHIDAPDRLVQVGRSYESAPRWDNFSFPALRLIARESPVFSGVAGYQSRAFTVGRGAETEQVLGQYVTGDYFEVLGAAPAVGRFLLPADDVEPGGHPVVVLSHSLWIRRFGADPDVVGRSLAIGSEPYEIVGVAPEGFVGPESIGTPPELFVPTMQRPSGAGAGLFEEWGSSWIHAFARLADGVGLAQAETAMAVVSDRLREASPVNEGMVVLLAPGVGLDPEGREMGRQLSTILLIIVGLVLLITCTNVANLFLARAAGRRGEVGVRMALGSGRARLARQLLTESLTLALVATALAVPMVLLADRFLPLVFPFTLSVSVGADGRVMAFLVGVGLFAGLLFGAAPAWSATRRDLAGTLREAGATRGRARSWLQSTLVVAQLGLSLGLVSGAALLGRSVQNVRSADPGVRTEGLIAAPLNLSTTGRFDEETGRELYRRVLDAADAIPGVRAAALAGSMPIAGGHARSSVQPPTAERGFEAEYIVVGPGYFRTLGIDILEGRTLGGFDDEPEPVVVVNRALAELFWPGGSAVGQELMARGGSWRVVGVSEDVQMRDLRSPARPAVYYPIAQQYDPFMALHLVAEPGRELPDVLVREAIGGVDPELPVPSVIRLEDAIAASMDESRTIGYLVGASALLALALAAVGLYGLVSYGASQRVREMGIRIALGAKPDSLIRLILGRGIAVAAVGVGVGWAISVALGRALESLLFGVAPSNAAILGLGALVLMATAALASWLPARRASRIDAAVTLREGG